MDDREYELKQSELALREREVSARERTRPMSQSGLPAYPSHNPIMIIDLHRTPKSKH
jgi:hypothetical protein